MLAQDGTKLFIAYLEDNELWMIGGSHWLERRLMYREMTQQERQKREEESAQLHFLSALRIAAKMRKWGGK